VNSFLDIVVDPVGPVVADTDQFAAGSWTATTIMEAIAASAMCAAPADSDAYKAFAKAKSVAMENLGGDTTVHTAPLDWYDPALVPKWADCSLQASVSSSSGTGAPPPAPPPSTPGTLWAWRTVQPTVAMKISEHVAQAVPPPKLAFSPIAMRAVSFAAPLAAVSPIARVAQPIVATKTVSTVTLANSVVLSQAISTAGNQASTSSVHTNSLSLHMQYRVVSLSRTPWWSELLMLLDDWYIPSLNRASIVADNTPQQSTGVPVAMILTNDVSITAAWSDADRAAATTNNHLGPWSLSSAKFSSATSAGVSTLTIPGVTAIGCIYQDLPPLPPKADPALPAH
jgi:hypothetical protein